MCRFRSQVTIPAPGEEIATMPSNIEIKAKVNRPRALEELARQRSDGSAEVLHQDDTFFHCTNGRLKLRDFGNGRGELIAYRRADQAGPKTSRYSISPTDDPAGLRTTLSESLGILGRVRKRRLLLMAGRTRIHLDEVEGLGSFMELEVVLAPGESEAEGVREADELMQALGIEPADLIEGAYLDLLLTSERR
ncbi:Putative adenylyl cyclase CyaB [Wenzhouxiangella marina]|uniref:Putative adenylyl cyclase CyaB n=2 Tax=Wenzhouxiangella marina TaxID=1579979 RepID=A0A0K0XVW5_9GAMM|nr:Putative adenylyl cyclase CyaB [Wenzhouxiangella marina]